MPQDRKYLYKIGNRWYASDPSSRLSADLPTLRPGGRELRPFYQRPLELRRNIPAAVNGPVGWRLSA
ncbi:hypothetical protein Thimo_3417 [Thioflavicoccus mobilis 8321]|uniref:Uncharacterized protein n=1 Tax=Thioflavicoccus mobilis 8321 TaxID=765912 RepID=L0H349_9GAMM|nr:hypothetical protein Thimo_3417 [Thioflavicoccus mobilis 8321]